MDFNKTNQKVKLANLIWIFLLSELSTLALIAYFMFYPQEQPVKSSDMNYIFLNFSYIVVIASIIISFYINNRMGAKAKKEKTRVRQVQLFFNSVIIRLGILELAGIILLVAFYFSKQLEPLYMFGIVFVAILLSKPSLHSLNKDFSPEFEKNDNIIIDSEKSDNPEKH